MQLVIWCIITTMVLLVMIVGFLILRAMGFFKEYSPRGKGGREDGER